MRKEASLLRILFSILVPLLLGAITFLCSAPNQLSLLIVAWLLVLSGLFVFDASKRVFYIVWLCVTLYNISAFYAAHYFGLTYQPFPTIQTIFDATALSMKCIFFGFAFAATVLYKLNWKKWLTGNIEIINNRFKKLHRVNLLAGTSLLALIGLLDWLKILSVGLGAILNSSRREYASELISTSNHNAQLVAIAITILFLFYFMNNFKTMKVTVAVAMFSLMIYWVPFVLVGSRKELLIIILVMSIYFISRYRLGKVPLILILFAVGLLFLLPAILNGSLEYSFHEFILPQYLLFSLWEHNIDLGYNYLSGVWFLLPSFFRVSDTVDLGTSFANLKLTNVGVGAHPVAEAFLNANNANLTIIFFTLVTTLLLLFIILLSKIDATYALIGLAYLLIWGRSDFWITLFFVIYIGLVIRLLTIRYLQKPAP